MHQPKKTRKGHMSQLAYNTYFRRPQLTVTIGGGVTIERILQVLRLQWMGMKMHNMKEAVTQIKSGEGPVEFVRVTRNYIKPECVKKFSLRDVIEQQGSLTYEVALRWFATESCDVFLQHGNRTIVVVTPEPLVIDGEPHGMYFRAGGEGPMITLWPVSLEMSFSKDDDFLSASNIGYGTPFCS